MIPDRPRMDAAQMIERINADTAELAERLACADHVGALEKLCGIRALADVIGRDCITRMLREGREEATP